MQALPEETVRRLREAAHILLTCLRCVAMKRALEVDDRDHLNFFRLYDGCLMDVAIVSWCKIFGSNKEQAYWERLLADDVAGARKAIRRAAGSRREFQALRGELRQYRDSYVAHHSYDEDSRPNRHPELMLVRETAQAAYIEVYDRLRAKGMTAGFPDPSKIMGDRLVAIEDHWRLIARTARKSIRHFDDVD